MIPSSYEELDAITLKCRKMVNHRALVSAGAAAVPVPGVDIATDIGLLVQLLPEINEKFGLTPDQISDYDVQTKMMLVNLVSRIGTQVAGRMVTKELVVRILQRMGVRLTAKQAARFVPVIGQMIAGGVSFAAMKLLCDRHIKECREVVTATLLPRADTTDEFVHS